MLLLFLRPDTPGPKDEDGKPLRFARQRVEHLIGELDKKPGEKIAIPTPALSEVLVKLGRAEAQKTVTALNKRAVFTIEPFDQRAAIELALMVDKKPKEGPETWAKMKFDRQVVAIAKVLRATVIYSDDGHVYKLGAKAGISVKRVRDLDVPPDAGQTELFDGEADA